MSVGIYIMFMGIYKCPWVFINVSGHVCIWLWVFVVVLVVWVFISQSTGHMTVT